mmetsp:Transcript_12057/g.19950  ORF Transcript_12057/g.19950 Transcript_12057/m.19950 type:complete len:203 (+) Transcript_12057:2005-2613(+)
MCINDAKSGLEDFEHCLVERAPGIHVGLDHSFVLVQQTLVHIGSVLRLLLGEEEVHEHCVVLQSAGGVRGVIYAVVIHGSTLCQVRNYGARFIKIIIKISTILMLKCHSRGGREMIAAAASASMAASATSSATAAPTPSFPIAVYLHGQLHRCVYGVALAHQLLHQRTCVVHYWHRRYVVALVALVGLAVVDGCGGAGHGSA